MKEAEQYYIKTGQALPGAQESQMFGKPCFKISNKAFISFFQDCIVCKLQGDARSKALELPGAILFDPSGKKRPMKEWVQVPFTHRSLWKKLASEAFKYVSGS